MEGFYSIAIKYLPRDETVSVTNIQVNEDYSSYLNFLRVLPTRSEPTPPEPIYPNIPCRLQKLLHLRRCVVFKIRFCIV